MVESGDPYGFAARLKRTGRCPLRGQGKQVEFLSLFDALSEKSVISRQTVDRIWSILRTLNRGGVTGTDRRRLHVPNRFAH